ncbi:MAG TPA: 7-cyano-7-deazaguanine synthase [Vicinamibacterales bacterium]|jgi:7-cyano-7-deazaguanine synthase|nr:7-cyano-7-deazaguanine synthase [Vicinamibacterales bacterium]
MSTAVLLSGGLDSVVLVAEEAARDEVQPIYVSVGLAWEHAERAAVARALAARPIAGHVRPLATLSVDMHDVYAATHWALTGQPPGYHTPDEDVYLPGRNVILLGKAGVYCAAAGLHRLVIGTLAHNPFPDATPEFRDAMARALTLGLGHALQIDAPYAGVTKADVIRRGAALGVPFELTLSCMKPIIRVREVREHNEPREPSEPREPILHCGTCSKCRERHDAFLDCGIADPTAYADEHFVRA